MARKKCNLTQKQVAELLDIKNTAVSKWECDTTLPDGRMLKKVAELYGVSSDYLLGLDDEFSLFDDARMPRSEIQQLFDEMTSAQQARMIAFAQGILASNDNSMSSNVQNQRWRA